MVSLPGAVYSIGTHVGCHSLDPSIEVVKVSKFCCLINKGKVKIKLKLFCGLIIFSE